MTNGSQLTKQEQIWLTEYQVCQEDNGAIFQGFWTLAAIFIGLSSAFLAGLIYAVIANKSLIDTMLTGNDPWKTLVIGIIALVVSAANVVILKKIKGWHGRIMLNQSVNRGRMLEIELILGMRKEWQHLVLDRWYDILKKKEDETWKNLKNKLKCKIDKKYHGKLYERKDEILGLIGKYFKDGKVKDRPGKYKPSSSTKYFPCILYTLMSLWGLAIIAGIYFIVTSAINIMSNS